MADHLRFLRRCHDAGPKDGFRTAQTTIFLESNPTKDVSFRTSAFRKIGFLHFAKRGSLTYSVPRYPHCFPKAAAASMALISLLPREPLEG